MTTVTPDLELAARLRLAVTRLARRLRQESGEGLTPSQNSALASIERFGGLTPSELATIERIQRPTVTRVLAGLSERNLVTREADTQDRRVVRIKVTREGAAVLKRGRSRKNAYLARRMRDLGPDELETLGRAAELIEHLLEGDDERR
ncbi:MAG TPA: MarR family transcriptional regulator [Solirubrobacteraceae bacterium]|jgi:DNA-binding MarR family transcriptional regulator|nr:MarR family transcriptional regulator [Solirubrobacteraceae bacterium]